MSKMYNAIRRTTAVILCFAVIFTLMPAMAGTLDAHAASYIKTLNASAAGQTAVNLSWTKLSKKQQKKVHGITVFRNGQAVANLSKKAGSYTDAGLAAGTTYTYQVKTYTKKIKKTKMWKNKTTGALQKKAPSKKQKKNFKKVTIKTITYKYSNASPARSVRTASAPAPTPAPAPSTPTTPSAPSSGGGTGGDDGSIEDRQNKEWERILSEGEYKELSVVDYKGDSTTIYSYTKNGKTQYFRYSNDARGYYLGISGYNPMNDSEVARVWRDYDGEFSGYRQKDGVTIAKMRARYNGSGAFSIDIYNGDLSKLKMKCENPTVEYTTYGQDLKNPEPIYRAAIIGKHGRRAASYEPDDLKGYEKVYDGYTYQTVGVNVSLEFDDADVTFAVYYDGAEIGRETLQFSYNEDNNLYNIGKTAVKYFRDGNSVQNFSAEDYNNLRSITSDYNADMRAIEWYVRDKYTYDEFQCTGGAAILEAYSVLEYGMYGHCCCSDPSNLWHVAFRPDDHVAQGDWRWYYETNGHR